MKKNIFNLLFLASLFLVLSVQLNGEDDYGEPCTPDCQNDEWSSVDSIDFHHAACCWTRVYYVYRIACGFFQDVQIVGIGHADGHKCTHPHLQYIPSQEEMFLDAMEAILAENPMNFSPLAGSVGCSTTWRITNRSCWASFEVTIYDLNGEEVSTYIHYIPCEQSGCCMARVEVCRLPNGNITLETIDPAQGDDCYLYAYINNGEPIPCVENCSWVPTERYEFDPYDILFPPIAKIAKVNQNYSNPIHMGLKTFNEPNHLRFQLFTENIEKLHIELYDLNGNIIEKKQIFNLSGVTEVYFSKSDLGSSGVLLYSIVSNNKTLKTGKILNIK